MMPALLNKLHPPWITDINILEQLRDLSSLHLLINVGLLLQVPFLIILELLRLALQELVKHSQLKIWPRGLDEYALCLIAQIR